MTYFSYLSGQVNTPAHIYFYPSGIPSYFYPPGLWESWSVSLWTFPSSASPTEDPAAFPQPPFPLGSLLLSILQVFASARRMKFRLFSGTFKALSTGTQLPFGFMSLIPRSQPPQELTNQAPGQMPVRPFHLLPVHFSSTSMGPSTRATSSMEPSLIPRWWELCPLLENCCARTAHLALSSPLPQGVSIHPWVCLYFPGSWGRPLLTSTRAQGVCEGWWGYCCLDASSRPPVCPGLGMPTLPRAG